MKWQYYASRNELKSFEQIISMYRLHVQYTKGALIVTNYTNVLITTSESICWPFGHCNPKKVYAAAGTFYLF